MRAAQHRRSIVCVKTRSKLSRASMVLRAPVSLSRWSIGCDWIKARVNVRSEEHTSELQSLMRISYAVFCLKKKKISFSQKITSKQYSEDHKHIIKISSHYTTSAIIT